MTRPTVDVPVPPRHVTQTGLGSDWMAIRANAQLVIVHYPADVGSNVYTIDGTTTNPRVMASADAIMWDGEIATCHYDDRTLTIQHCQMGVLTSVPIDVFLDEPVPVLARSELVALEGTGGRVQYTCVDCGDDVDRERHQMDIAGITPRRCTSCTFDRMGERR